MMKKFSFILTALMLSAITLFGQNTRFEDKEDDKPATTEQPDIKPPARQPVKPTFWERTRFGGNFGAGFGNGFSFVNVSPRMYYLATEKLWLGTGVTFIWSKDNYYLPPFDQQFVYGFNLSAQYMLFGPLFVQAEYEPLSFERVSVNPISGEFAEERVWAQGLLLGGGISQPMGRGRFFASVLYNVTWTSDINSYYYSPWVFRIGFGI